MKYFAIDLEDDLDSLDEENVWAELLEDAEQKDQAREIKSRIVDEKQVAVDQTPWLRQVNWPRIFAGKNMMSLMELIRLPGADEPRLQLVTQSVQRVISGRCMDGLFDMYERGWSLIGYWLNSIKKNEPATKPFRQYYNDLTI